MIRRLLVDIQPIETSNRVYLSFDDVETERLVSGIEEFLRHDLESTQSDLDNCWYEMFEFIELHCSDN
jgi:hypothetical protein